MFLKVQTDLESLINTHLSQGIPPVYIQSVLKEITHQVNSLCDMAIKNETSSTTATNSDIINEGGELNEHD